MRAAIDGAHAACFQTFFNAIFAGESLTQQFISGGLEGSAVRGAEGCGVRILCSTLRTCFHRTVASLLSFGEIVASLSHGFEGAKRGCNKGEIKMRARPHATLACLQNILTRG